MEEAYLTKLMFMLLMDYVEEGKVCTIILTCITKLYYMIQPIIITKLYDYEKRLYVK